MSSDVSLLGDQLIRQMHRVSRRLSFQLKCQVLLVFFTQRFLDFFTFSERRLRHNYAWATYWLMRSWYSASSWLILSWVCSLSLCSWSWEKFEVNLSRKSNSTYSEGFGLHLIEVVWQCLQFFFVILDFLLWDENKPLQVVLTEFRVERSPQFVLIGGNVANDWLQILFMFLQRLFSIFFDFTQFGQGGISDCRGLWKWTI